MVVGHVHTGAERDDVQGVGAVKMTRGDQSYRVSIPYARINLDLEPAVSAELGL